MYRAFDEVNKKWDASMTKGIVYISDKYIEFGWFSDTTDCVGLMYEDRKYLMLATENNMSKVKFDRRSGIYMLPKYVNDNHVFSTGNFPYTFNRYYSTRFLEEVFEKKTKAKELINFNYIDELPYTFGLEFETAAGFIPEQLLKENGLIPLRDGSISGLEYSTIVLSGNRGFNILKNQIEILKEYTIFDKDCSLHLHLGNFNLCPETLLRLNNLFSKSNIRWYVPELAFNTNEFKTNRDKNYCEMNKQYASFDSMYKEMVGRSYYGSLYQPHPNDTKAERKWNIHSRYKAINFINAICYKNAKTVEFRFLHPCYNFDRIICWIYVLAAFLKYSETNYDYELRIDKIISAVYSKELADILNNMLTIQYDVIKTQYDLGDRYGARVDVEDTVMSYKNLSYNNKFFY